MVGIELVRDRQTKEPAPEIVKAVQESAKRRGLIIGRGGLHANTIRLCPPLIVTRADVDAAIEILDMAFADAGAVLPAT
jgi:4-aminobutyrate aminotransferase-like enzyme